MFDPSTFYANVFHSYLPAHRQDIERPLPHAPGVGDGKAIGSELLRQSAVLDLNKHRKNAPSGQNAPPSAPVYYFDIPSLTAITSASVSGEPT